MTDDMTGACGALGELLDSGEPLESKFQELIEAMPELVPLLDVLNHGVQWESLISKFALAPDRNVDVAFVTKSSDTWRGVLIELESPGKRLFVDSGYPDFHSDTRKAIAQVEHWKTIADADPQGARERFRPLMHFSPAFDENPVEFAYVLIIGRSPEGRLGKDKANLIERLRRERRIRLMTWDSVLRHAQTAQSRRWRWNVLSHHRAGFKFKRANCGTLLFGDFTPDQISLDPDAETFFRADGYDIDSWRAGKLLTVNQKFPVDGRHDIGFRTARHPASTGSREES